MKTQKKTYIFALVPFLLLCLLFEIIPVIFTVIRSFFPEGGDMGFTLDNLSILIYLPENCISRP